jgi:hypothetical protein
MNTNPDPTMEVRSREQAYRFDPTGKSDEQSAGKSRPLLKIEVSNCEQECSLGLDV